MSTSNTDRRSLIAARAKSAKTEAPATTAEPTKEVSRDPNDLSVADVAREMGINPKVARAKLRRHNIRAKDGRHARVMRDTPAYHALVAMLAPKKADTPAS